VTFDCKDYESMTALVKLLEMHVFNRVNDVINERLPTIKWDIPLVVEYEVGPDWGTMTKLDKTSL
jgi:hypothetical protein